MKVEEDSGKKTMNIRNNKLKRAKAMLGNLKTGFANCLNAILFFKMISEMFFKVNFRGHQESAKSTSCANRKSGQT